jgi:hypothetical protein
MAAVDDGWNYLCYSCPPHASHEREAWNSRAGKGPRSRWAAALLLIVLVTSAAGEHAYYDPRPQRTVWRRWRKKQCLPS